MGSRKQLRANLKQDGATSAACARRGGLLGDMAYEDLRSGSIIVVISVPRCKPRLPGRVLRPPCFSVCLQPTKATGKGHGAGRTAPRPCSAPAAAQLFIHLKRGHGTMFISVCCLFKCLFDLQYRWKDVKYPGEGSFQPAFHTITKRQSKSVSNLE